MRADGTAKLLDACEGNGFAGLRDEALIRLSEVGNHASRGRRP